MRKLSCKTEKEGICGRGDGGIEGLRPDWTDILTFQATVEEM